MNPIDYFGLAGVPVITALTQVSKAWVEDDRWYPVLSIAWGVALNLAIAALTGGHYGIAAFIGMVAGLGASGLYSYIETYRGVA